MAKVAHYVSKNKGTRRIQQCIWFDTETKPKILPNGDIEHVLWYGYAVYSAIGKDNAWSRGKWCRFTCAREFVTFISKYARAKTRLYVWCHNTNFDVPVLDLLRAMHDQDWLLTRAIIEAPPTMLTFRRGQSTVIVGDTLNFWRMKLSAIGEMFDEPKLPMPPAEAPRRDWDRYCQQDCRVIMRACQAWWKLLTEEDLGDHALTLAAQSMHTYRHRSMEHKIAVPDQSIAQQLSRDAYLGGRVECFFIGTIHEPVVSLDVNSMYPYVMRNHYFPCGLRGIYADRDVDWLRRELETRCVVARVHVHTNEPVFGVQRDHRLLFPVGKFWATLSTPEIEYALDHEMVDKVDTACIYHRAKLFTEFVNYFYTRRIAAKKAGNLGLSHMYKILLNSLYGKFGQRGHKVISSEQIDDLSAGHTRIYNTEDDTFRDVVQLGGLRYVQVDEPETSDSFPAIAAHVTARGRMYLWSIMRHRGGDLPLYCDTDAIICRTAGVDRFVDLMEETTLGRLKVEHEGASCTIRGLKDYTIGNTDRCKGARSNAVWLSPDECRQEQWDGLKGLVRAGRMDRPRIHTVTKHFSRLYGKGMVQPDGRVLPVTLDL